MFKASSWLLAALIATAVTTYAEDNTNTATDTSTSEIPTSVVIGPPDPKQALHLQIVQEQLFLSKNDIAKITTTNAYGAKALQVILTEDGAKKLQQFTGDHLNQVLQISWDHDILSQTTVMTVLPGQLVLIGPSQDKVQEVLKGFRKIS